MKGTKRLKYLLDMLFRSLLILELFWSGWLAITTAPLAYRYTLMIAVGSLVSVPLINRLQQKWPPVYQLIALLLLFSGIWALSGFNISLAAFLVLIGAMGSIPLGEYNRLMMLLPAVLYGIGYLQNSLQQRFLAFAMFLTLLLILLLQEYLKEIGAALDLSRAVDGTPQGSFLVVSRRQLKLLAGTITGLGLLLIGIFAWLRPFAAFVYRPKELKPPEQPLTDGSREVFQPQPNGFDPGQLVGEHEPNLMLLQFWALLENIMKLLLIVAVILLLLFTCYQMFRYLKVKRAPVEEDTLPVEADFVLLEKRSGPQRRVLLSPGDYNQRVRRLFKKEVGKHFRKEATPSQLLFTLSLTPSYAKRLAELYEKARYDQEAISKKEWRQLKELRKGK